MESEIQTKKNLNLGTRAVILALRSRIVGMSTEQVSKELGIPARTVRDVLARAKKNGFDPAAPTFSIQTIHYEDAPRSGRPTNKLERG